MNPLLNFYAIYNQIEDSKGFQYDATLSSQLLQLMNLLLKEYNQEFFPNKKWKDHLSVEVNRHRFEEMRDRLKKGSSLQALIEGSGSLGVALSKKVMDQEKVINQLTQEVSDLKNQLASIHSAKSSSIAE